jgi:hypothetical protein
MGEELSVSYLMSGWINGQRTEKERFAWSRGGRSTVLLRFAPGEDYEMLVRIRPHKGLGSTHMDVELNGVGIAGLELKDDWAEYRITIPSGQTIKGINRVMFVFDETVKAKEDFGDVWTEGAAVEYMRKMFLPNQRDDEVIVLDWEQDNSKFGEEELSAAFDYISLSPKGNRQP